MTPAPTGGDGGQKARYVSAMFGRVAARYDLMNRLMSLGMDGAWRRAAVAALSCHPGDLVLDVATGTGDFLPLLAGRGYAATGVDFSLPMLRAGGAKVARLGAVAALAAADALQLPFADGTFAGVTNGFLLRNVADVAGAMEEMRRVLRPGGTLVCLEITWPRSPVVRPLFSFYFGRLMPLLGGLISSQPDAYAYLPRSAAAFMDAPTLARTMASVGLREVRYQLLNLGSVALHVARR